MEERLDRVTSLFRLRFSGCVIPRVSRLRQGMPHPSIVARHFSYRNFSDLRAQCCALRFPLVRAYVDTRLAHGVVCAPDPFHLAFRSLSAGIHMIIASLRWRGDSPLFNAWSQLIHNQLFFYFAVHGQVEGVHDTVWGGEYSPLLVGTSVEPSGGLPPPGGRNCDATCKRH